MKAQGRWDYKNIAVRPDLYKELAQVKNEAQKEVGVKFDWNAFIAGLLIGGGATAAGIAIAKAVKKYRKKRQI